jgi:threonine/homoserine/homoserine lactone efflux protein
VGVSTLLAFVPVAALLTITPGVATAMVVRNAARGGQRHALAMAALLVVFDLIWYSAVAFGVTRAKRAFVEGPWLRRVERLTGAVLIALGVRLAIERR